MYANGNEQEFVAVKDSGWRPRHMFRRHKQNAEGHYAWGFGARIGYWPCLRAPYLTIDYGTRAIDLWVGWRSYLYD